MSVIIPGIPAAMQLALAADAHTTGLPVPLLEYRHIPIDPGAQVLSLIGLTGDNLPVGFAVGGLDDDEPRTVVVVGEPRDPALAVRAGARMADILDPLIAGGAGIVPQLLLDGPNTLDALNAWALRLRNPWLPGPYGADPDLRVAAERCRHAFALIRSVTTAAKIPDTDVLVTAVEALTGHLMFPLAGAQESQQLAVLLLCLYRAGAPITVPLSQRDIVRFIEQIEAAEEITLSAATDPGWDNKRLFPALYRFKHLRNATAGRDQMRRVDAAVVDQVARASGLHHLVRAALVDRHRAVAEAFRALRELPELPSLPVRRAGAVQHARRTLQRGAAHEMAWRDFPTLAAANADGRRRDDLKATALIDSVRYDRRAFAYAQARGEATVARPVAVSPDGRRVELEFAVPLAPRGGAGWWWLDDRGPAPIAGDLEVAADGRAGQLTVRQQMRRLAADPQILVGQGAIRLTCLTPPFEGRPWSPRSDIPNRPANPGVIIPGAVQPDGSEGPGRWATPIDFRTLGD
ncbi:hypothetical protein [Catenuloplanes japonicus]|uniref:hypothetical protein n=1 Tax=Catenuloplanes japonicus TaxID=33876 RepID=UPI0005276AE9|nr:hypothetical protein [Catenuloplanes japonicus]